MRILQTTRVSSDSIVMRKLITSIPEIGRDGMMNRLNWITYLKLLFD
jgi:hypothetical protein